MKPEASELVLRGCRSVPLSPPLELPPGPRRFLKKSSKNSSNGEPGGNCGIAPLPPSPALASTVCDVEMLTTASITFSATSAMPSGPRARAGAEIGTPVTPRLAAPSQIAANQGRRRRLEAGIARVISLLSWNGFGNLKSTVRPNGVAAQAFEPDISLPRTPLNTAKYRPPPPTMALIPQHFCGRRCDRVIPGHERNERTPTLEIPGLVLRPIPE